MRSAVMDWVIALVSTVDVDAIRVCLHGLFTARLQHRLCVNAASALPNAVPLSTVRLLIMDAPFFHPRFDA